MSVNLLTWYTSEATFKTSIWDYKNLPVCNFYRLISWRTSAQVVNRSRASKDIGIAYCSDMVSSDVLHPVDLFRLLTKSAKA